MAEGKTKTTNTATAANSDKTGPGQSPAPRRDMFDAILPGDARVRKPLALLLALASILIFAWALDYPINGVIKFFAILGLLGVSGEAIRRLLSVEGEWGLMLLRTQRGLVKMEELAKANPALWRAFAEFGLVLGFGAFSIVMYRNISKKVYFATLAFLALSYYLILPFILPVALSVISGLPVGSISSRGGASSIGGLDPALVQYAYLAFLLLFGYAIAGMVGLVMNALHVVSAVFGFLGGSGTALATASPGASPIIPGKNIPLFEGLIALSIILIVHEGAHGILARLYKIKLKSAGVVLYGILPVGAFVDPDEEALQAAPKDAQRDVLVAGSASNFATCFAAFFLLLFFFLATAPVQDTRVFASAYLNATPALNATQISQINGRLISSPSDVVSALSEIPASRQIQMNTSDGRLVSIQLDANFSITSMRTTVLSCAAISCDSFNYEKRPGESTRISLLLTNAAGHPFVPLGTRLGPYTYSFTYSNAFQPGWGWLNFIYGVLGLSLVLNFLIGSVNLMPIPMFDGNRLITIAVPNPVLMKIITYTVSLSFVLNLLPWAWA